MNEQGIFDEERDLRSRGDRSNRLHLRKIPHFNRTIIRSCIHETDVILNPMHLTNPVSRQGCHQVSDGSSMVPHRAHLQQKESDK